MPDLDLGASLRTESARFLAEVPDPSWERICALGWPGAEIPEEHGGLGLSFSEVCLLLEEQGRVMHAGPFFATAVLGAGALLGATEEQRAAWLPRIAAGTVVTAAIDGGSARAERGRLHGEIAFVPDLDAAEAVVVAAGDALHLVRREDLEPVAQPVHDRTRLLFGATLAGVAGEPLPGSAAALRDRAAVALAADCAGGASRALEMTAEYLRDRRQFGRPIGSFQALQHRCADMLLAVERARVAAGHAAAAPPGRAAASIAKSCCAASYVHVAGEAVSLHGGIGFTWEHAAHRHLKRAKLNEVWMGGIAWHRERLARLALGLED